VLLGEVLLALVGWRTWRLTTGDVLLFSGEEEIGEKSYSVMLVERISTAADIDRDIVKVLRDSEVQKVL
jgi:hypothetical protein